MRCGGKEEERATTKIINYRIRCKFCTYARRNGLNYGISGDEKHWIPTWEAARGALTTEKRDSNAAKSTRLHSNAFPSSLKLRSKNTFFEKELIGVKCACVRENCIAVTCCLLQIASVKMAHLISAIRRWRRHFQIKYYFPFYCLILLRFYWRRLFLTFLCSTRRGRHSKYFCFSLAVSLALRQSWRFRPPADGNVFRIRVRISRALTKTSWSAERGKLSIVFDNLLQQLERLRW